MHTPLLCSLPQERDHEEYGLPSKLALGRPQVRCSSTGFPPLRAAWSGVGQPSKPRSQEAQGGQGAQIPPFWPILMQPPRKVSSLLCRTEHMVVKVCLLSFDICVPVETENPSKKIIHREPELPAAVIARGVRQTQNGRARLLADSNIFGVCSPIISKHNPVRGGAVLWHHSTL